MDDLIHCECSHGMASHTDYGCQSRRMGPCACPLKSRDVLDRALVTARVLRVDVDCRVLITAAVAQIEDERFEIGRDKARGGLRDGWRSYRHTEPRPSSLL